jgi:hypothetical protein
MASLDTPSGRAALMAAVVLITLGVLGALPSFVGLVGLLAEDRFTWERASSALIVLVCGAVVIAAGIMLDRRTFR